MAKFSLVDKLRIQTLREQGYGAKAIRAAYPDKNWSLRTLNKICQRVDERGSAIERKKGSGRPKSARTQQNIDFVGTLICSQEEKPGTHSSSREIASQLGISQQSVIRIAKIDLNLTSFRRVPAQVLNSATREKRVTRCKQLIRRCTVKKTKRLFFTDEKIFYIDPPVNTSTSRVWSSASKKSDVSPQRLVRQRAKFSPHVMVSAGVCCVGKGRLHFVDEKAKINAKYYTEQLLPQLIEDCRSLMGNDFVFQQDGAPAHTAGQTQEWLMQNCPEFINKNEWPPNSPDLNPLDYSVWGAMLQRFEKIKPKPKNVAELKVALQNIWEELPQQSIKKTVMSFRKRLQACVRADGGHFEHLLS